MNGGAKHGSKKGSKKGSKGKKIMRGGNKTCVPPNKPTLVDGNIVCKDQSGNKVDINSNANVVEVKNPQAGLKQVTQPVLPVQTVLPVPTVPTSQVSQQGGKKSSKKSSKKASKKSSKKSSKKASKKH